MTVAGASTVIEDLPGFRPVGAVLAAECKRAGCEARETAFTKDWK